MLHKKEAALLRPYVEAELKSAIATYRKKYKMKLPGAGAGWRSTRTTTDFAVRTLGLPGIGRAGRYIRHGGGDGQPFRASARRVSLGEHDVA